MRKSSPVELVIQHAFQKQEGVTKLMIVLMGVMRMQLSAVSVQQPGFIL